MSNTLHAIVVWTILATALVLFLLYGIPWIVYDLQHPFIPLGGE